jgi:glycine betaine/proline transport system ATP-binding protein
VIEIRSLSKIYGPRPRSALSLLRSGKSKSEIFQRTGNVVALHNINLSLAKGKISVLIGFSGSGKSTLLRCINRLVEPTEGIVRVGGTDILVLSLKELRGFRQRTFGMVFQQFSLFPHYTVLENAAFGLEVQGLDKKTREERARRELERVGLADWADSRPHTLSGGMQQRVGIARALSLDPEILLMDEPFSGLDPLTRSKMQAELLRLQGELQKTIVFISHDLKEALSLGSRIAFMDDGEIIQEGTPEELVSKPANETVSAFVRNVDRSRVLTAGSVMEPPQVFRMGVDNADSALRKMEFSGSTLLFVVNTYNTLLGVVTRHDMLRLREDENPDPRKILRRNLTTIQPTAALADTLAPLAQLLYPLPVVDGQGRLKGVITRTMALEALARTSADTGAAG